MKITVNRDGKQQAFNAEAGRDLLDILTEQGIYISAACGGTGRCGKCKVRMLMGATECTEQDIQFFGERELKEGWRLACLSRPQEDCEIFIGTGDETDFDVVSDYHSGENTAPFVEESEYEIGIDIGTTTIAVNLIGAVSGQVIKTVTSINRQRAYGADVISRIQASNEGKGEELKSCIRKDLYDGIKKIIKESGIDSDRVRQIAIAGNTTMGHLFLGLSCETLGVYPFTPVDIGTISNDFTELFQEQMGEDGEDALRLKAQVLLLPGISTYVGADISAGMLSCGFDKLKRPALLIDLGTNGEMALGNEDRILVTSTAAGPAFEGGNISCGMGSVQGAICKVSIHDNKASVATIGDKPPIGLCGTGVIETVSELVKEELVDETGMLDEDYFEEGFELAKTPEGEPILFTQKDIREIQLAKSAVRAGVETLLLRYGIGYDEVEQVFLAGGFGYKIDLDKTVFIGMLPEELKDRITAVGNSSLGGTAAYLTEKDARERLDKIVSRSQEIELSSDKDFNNFYTEYMFFGE